MVGVPRLGGCGGYWLAIPAEAGTPTVGLFIMRCFFVRLSSSWRLLFGMVALLLVVATGCGDRYYQVQGQVLRSGEPIALPDCRITFLDAERGIVAPAIIGPDGKYRLGPAPELALRPGTYAVVVSFPNECLPPTDPNDPLKALPTEELEQQLGRFIPRKYRDPKTSGLTLTITNRNVLDFNVDMRE
jgi:hypothetical protein